MIHIELEDEEANVLAELLESTLATLDVEIHRTDRLTFKNSLSHRRQILQELLARLPHSTHAA